MLQTYYVVERLNKVIGKRLQRGLISRELERVRWLLLPHDPSVGIFGVAPRL